MTPVEARPPRPVALRLAGRSLRFVLKFAPFELFERRPEHLYVPAYFGRSAHKALDIRELPGFGELARHAVEGGRTLLYYDKLFTVYQAIENIRQASTDGSTITIADVGAFRGGGGYFMAACAEAVGFRTVGLHCFDTFDGHQEGDVRPDLEPTQEAGRQIGRYRDVSADEVREYLSRFPGAIVHAGRIQDTASEVESLRFDLAHVDVNLYEPTAFALSFLHERMAPNGIIVVDDYGAITNPGVSQAAREFLESHGDYVHFYLLSDQCLLLRRPPEAGT